MNEEMKFITKIQMVVKAGMNMIKMEIGFHHQNKRNIFRGIKGIFRAVYFKRLNEYCWNGKQYFRGEPSIKRRRKYEILCSLYYKWNNF